ncbi:homoserine kinase [Winogradskyella sp.]|uniref:homoserine kinase n=1 Tax=Winogradskyella sp. TaxID=1883156 RepID=UPI0035C8254B
MDHIKIFSPATVANVSCGYDVLGFCLDSVGDEMIIHKISEKGVKISKIDGYDLPYEIEKNVAGVSALAMYEALQPDCGFDIEIYKKIKPGSGIGSSSASAAGSVFGMNELLGRPLNKTELTKYALKGEALASQCEHADNLAPAIFGGFTLVRSVDPIDVLQLPTLGDLFATLIHPQIEIKTSESRAILPKNVALKDAITQWSNVGSLVHALHTNDYDILSKSLNDTIAEPHRKQLIPHFDSLKGEVIKAGALGCGISGSGPSIFALSHGEKMAKEVEKTMQNVYSKTEIPFYTFISKVNSQGIKIL